MTRNNRATVERYYRELWNEWNLAAIAEIISPNIEFRGSLGVSVHGRDEFRAYVEAVRAAFPDFHNQIEEIVTEGDKVVARLTYTGTHEGNLFGVAGTGRKVSYAGVAIFRIDAGVIEEGWVLGDVVSLRRQIGASLVP